MVSSRVGTKSRGCSGSGNLPTWYLITISQTLAEDSSRSVRGSARRASVRSEKRSGLAHSQSERRSIELEATPAGALALREHARGIAAIARGMLEALPERDQQALITILRRVVSRIDAAERRTA